MGEQTEDLVLDSITVGAKAAELPVTVVPVLCGRKGGLNSAASRGRGGGKMLRGATVDGFGGGSI